VPSRADDVAYHAALAPQLAERVRVLLALALVAICVFAVADFVAHRAEVDILWLLAVAQAGALAIAWSALGGEPTWRRAVVVPIVTLSTVFASGVTSDALSSNLLTTPLSAVCVAIATAALLPWGALPQAAMATVAALTCLASIVFVRGSFDELAHPVATVAVLLAGSVYVSSITDRLRRGRAAMDEALEAAARQAEAEARVASVVAHAGAVLAAHLDEPDMLDRVLSVARDALGVDWSSTFVVDERSGALRLAATVGTRAALREELADLELPLAWLEPPPGAAVLEIADAAERGPANRAMLARLDVAALVAAPLSCRGKLLGVQVHGRRTRPGGFTPEQRDLVTGIAHATALALENSRRIAELEAASRLKSEFVATMSHELRTPLNVITGYTEMLVDEGLGPLTEGQHETLGRVRRSAEELLELVNATLDLGRLEAGRMPVIREPVDVVALLEELDGEVRPLLAAGVELGWEAPPGGRAVVVDRRKLKTVLKNLAGNACKFTPAGRVDVTIGWADDELRCAVRDTGIGIAPEQVPLLFEMFRQGDGSATRRFGGVGLGLHIVHRLVELLGGTVEVESAVGRGSTFRVTVPAPLALRAIGGERRAAARG
jgi:signal transduction histidine kinase